MPDFYTKDPQGFARVLKESPLHIFFAGREAVLFFFVLSGFVLSLPFHGARGDAYLPYVVKRITRIWIPYIVAVAGALAARTAFKSQADPTLSDWYRSIWAGSLTPGSMAAHISLIAPFDDRILDPVVWSLTHEMRISLIFPLLMVAVVRNTWWVSVLCGLALSVAGVAMQHLGIFVSLGQTMTYLLMFIVGILLAQYRSAIANAYQRMPSIVRVGTLVAAVLAYIYPWLLPQLRAVHLATTNDYATTLGVTLFMITALGSVRAAQMLDAPPLLALGRISYSLYLWHSIVLISLLHVGLGHAPLWLLLIAVLPISLAIAELSQRFIEVPAQQLGRRLAQRTHWAWPSLDADQRAPGR